MSASLKLYCKCPHIPAVCLFEATHRVGGRIYSVRGLGPNGDLTLDMGAYRYMPLAQPLITDLIENLLALPNRLYQVRLAEFPVATCLLAVTKHLQ